MTILAARQLVLVLYLPMDAKIHGWVFYFMKDIFKNQKKKSAGFLILYTIVQLTHQCCLFCLKKNKKWFILTCYVFSPRPDMEELSIKVPRKGSQSSRTRAEEKLLEAGGREAWYLFRLPAVSQLLVGWSKSSLVWCSSPNQFCLFQCMRCFFPSKRALKAACSQTWTSNIMRSSRQNNHK